MQTIVNHAKQLKMDALFYSKIKRQGTVFDKDTTYEWWTNCNLYYWPDEFIGTPRPMQTIVNHAKQLKMDALFYSKTKRQYELKDSS